MNLFDLACKLTLDSSEYKKGLTDAEKQGSGFGSKLKSAMKIGAAAVTAVTSTVTALTGALVSGTNEVAMYGDNIDKMSQKMGISSDAFQEWDAVLKHNGSSIESMSKGMLTLQKKAAAGSEAFEKLGLTQEQVASMSTEELFAATIEGLQNMGEGAERTALAAELLGGAAKELGPTLNMSAKETEEMKKRIHELGGVMSEDAVKSAAAYKDQLQDMQTAFSGMKRGLLSDFMPSLTTVMGGLTELFSGGDGLGKISEGISGLVDKIAENTPRILDVGTKIILSLGEAITANLPVLLKAGVDAIMTLGKGIVENLPDIIEAGLQVLLALGQGIAENLPTLIPTIVDVVLQIVDTLTNPETIVSIVDAALDIIVALADGLLKALPKLIGAIPKIIWSVITAIVGALPQFIIAGYELLTALIADAPAIIAEVLTFLPTLITEIIAGLLDSIPLIIDAGIELLTAIIDDMPTIIENIIEALPLIITSIVETLVGNAGRIIEAGVKLIVALVDGLIKSIPKLVQAAPQLLKGIVDGITGSLKMVWDAGMNIVRGIWQGISNGFSWIKGKITGWVGDLLGFFKRILKIASPSKLFADQVGRFLGLGIGQGFVDVMPAVEDMMAGAMPDPAGLVGPLDFRVSGGARGRTDSELLALLRDIRDNMDTDLVLSDGTLIGWMDKALGRRATQRARGNA